MDRAACRSCRADILWVKMASGKSMPLDAKPTSQGNIDVRDGIGHVLPKEQRTMFAAPLYESLFATCPNAKQHRRKERAS